MPSINTCSRRSTGRRFARGATGRAPLELLSELSLELVLLAGTAGGGGGMGCATDDDEDACRPVVGSRKQVDTCSLTSVLLPLAAGCTPSVIAGSSMVRLFGAGVSFDGKASKPTSSPRAVLVRV